MLTYANHNGTPHSGSSSWEEMISNSDEPLRIGLARIMHRFSSRSAESAGLARRATKAPASVLYGTLRRPTERNTVRTSEFGDVVENLCIIRASFQQPGTRL